MDLLDLVLGLLDLEFGLLGLEAVAESAAQLRHVTRRQDAPQDVVTPVGGEYGGALPVGMSVGVNLIPQGRVAGVWMGIAPLGDLEAIQLHHGGDPHIQGGCRQRGPRRTLFALLSCIPGVEVLLSATLPLVGEFRQPDTERPRRRLGLIGIVGRVGVVGIGIGIVAGVTLPLLGRRRRDPVGLEDLLEEQAKFLLAHRIPVDKALAIAPALRVFEMDMASAHTRK